MKSASAFESNMGPPATYESNVRILTNTGQNGSMPSGSEVHVNPRSPGGNNMGPPPPPSSGSNMNPPPPPSHGSKMDTTPTDRNKMNHVATDDKKVNHALNFSSKLILPPIWERNMNHTSKISTSTIFCFGPKNTKIMIASSSSSTPGIPRDTAVLQVYPPGPSDGPGPNCKFHWMVLLDLPRKAGPSRIMDICVKLFQRLMEHVRAPCQRSMLIFFHTMNDAKVVVEQVMATPEAESDDTKYALKLFGYCDLFWSAGGNSIRSYGVDLDNLMRIINQKTPHDKQIEEDPRDKIIRNAVNAMATDILVDTMMNSGADLGSWLRRVSRLSRPQSLLSPNGQLHHYCFNLQFYTMVPQFIRFPSQNKAKIEAYYLLSIDSYRQTGTSIGHPFRACGGQGRPSLRERACNKESQAVRVAISITFSAFIQKWTSPASEELTVQQYDLCSDAIELAEEALTQTPWPWSAQFIPHCLFAAWCISQGEMKHRLRQLLERYRRLPLMWKFLEEAAHWKEAPTKLAKEISWFPPYQPRDETSEQDGDVEVMCEPMDSFCTVM